MLKQWNRAALSAILAVSLLLAASCAPQTCPPQPACPPAIACPPAPPVSTRVKIFVTNDVHGYALADPGKGRIGYALLKGRVDAAEAEGYQTYLFDAGDAFSGSAFAQFDSGRSIAGLMGRMGYRAMTPGNHAFDYNLPENDPLYYASLLRMVREADDGPLSAVSVNLTLDGGDYPGVSRDPVVIRDGHRAGGDGLRLVVAGVTTPYTATRTNRDGLPGYGFGLVERDGKPDHEATRRNIVDMLTAALRPYDQPGDMVIVLAHVGHDNSEDYAHGQLSGRDLAAVPNVDVLSDAHSHTKVKPERIGGAWYASGGRYLENFVEITIVAENGRAETTAELKSFADMQGTIPDPAITGAVAETGDRLGLGVRLFQVGDGELLDDAGLDRGNLPLGRFLCRAMAEISGADVALYNSGGIRAGIHQGWATVGSLYNVIPFMNSLVSYRMTGAEITGMFRSLPALGTNGFPQFYGMTVYAWNDNGKLGVAGVLDRNGRPLDPAARYITALNSFMAEGGDGFVFANRGLQNDFGDAATAIIKHLKENSDPRLEELRENRELLLYPNREEAEKAWTKATRSAGAGKAA